MVKREKKPIITKESISNADIVLYHLSDILKIPNNNKGYYWFPITYIYHNYQLNIWRKLKSKEHCNKLLPLFGAKDINELEQAINKTSKIDTMGYPTSFERVPTILSNITLDEIGIIN